MRRWIPFALALGIVGSTLVPYWLGWWWTPEGMEFLWNRRVNNADLPTYLALIERVRAGELLLENPYTVEPQRLGMIRPAYWSIGLLAKLTGLNAVTAYQIGRIAFGIGLVLSVYRLTAVLGREVLGSGRSTRLLCTTLVCLGGGISWIGALVMDRPAPWPDAWQTEATVYGTLLESPHFCFGLLMMLEFVTQLHRALRAGTAGEAGRPLALCGLALALGLFEQPYNGPLCAVLGSTLILLAYREGASPGRLALASLVGVSAAALPAIWLLLLIELDPTYAAWSAQNVLKSPPLPAYLAAFAPLWALAALGLFLGWQRLGRIRWLLIVWALAPAVLVELPVSFQRRMAEGWIVPLGLLAGVALSRLRVPHAQRPIVVALLTLLACAGSLHLIVNDAMHHRSATPRSYKPSTMMDSLRALAERAEPDDVVVASYGFSVWAPAFAPVRVLHGHRIQGRPSEGSIASVTESLESARYLRVVPEFAPPLETARFLVFFGPAPRAPDLRIGEFRAPPWLGPGAFVNESTVIYDLSEGDIDASR